MTLEELVAAVLGVPAHAVTDASSPTTITSWDSMATMNLVAAIEETYRISLSTTEIRGLTSVAAARTLLAKRGITA